MEQGRATVDERDERIDAAVRRTAIGDEELAAMPLAAGFDAVWREVMDRAAGPDGEDAAGVVDDTLPARRDRGGRRWRRAVVAGVAGAVVVTGAGVAAAGVYQAHTGRTLDDAGLTSELLVVNAPDFVDVARGYAEGVRFAPGYSAEQYWGILVSPGGVPLAEKTTMTVDGVKTDIRSWASCSWQRAWLTARAHDDAAATATAAAQVEAFAVDPLLAHYDSAQPQYARAVATGDVAVIELSVRMGCPVPTPVVSR